MQKVQLPYQRTGHFSSLIQDYLEKSENLSPFYNRFAQPDSFAAQIAEKESNYHLRENLVTALRKQYDQAGLNSALIERLSKANCFTITTGHQLCLFTGPLYFIYKIVSTIKLAEDLRKQHPQSDFLPVFWMATEDHDFEEVNHAYLFGNKLSWESGQAGAVGRMQLTGIDEVLLEFEQILGNSPFAEEVKSTVRAAYLKAQNWADATRRLVIKLFGDNRLLVIDGDDKELKKIFVPQILKELDEQLSYREVEKTGAQLGLKYPLQVSPREINLFYLGDQLRERIVFQEGNFKVLHTNISFSPQEIEKEVKENPEKFSPNVILRPLYQETILPNLAYIGGGGELAYWLQLKSMFSAFGITFPMLVLRNSVLWIGKNEARKIQNLQLNIQDLFGDKEELTKRIVLSQTESGISLSAEKERLSELFDAIATRATEIDPTLKAMVLADEKRALNSIDVIEKRMMKAEKDKHTQSINQLSGVFDKLFPNGSLQERHNNFFELYLKQGAGFIELLLKELEPLDFSLTIFIETEKIA